MNKSCPECVIPFWNHLPLSSTGWIKFCDDNIALACVPRVSKRKHRPFYVGTNRRPPEGTARVSYSSQQKWISFFFLFWFFFFSKCTSRSGTRSETSWAQTVTPCRTDTERRGRKIFRSRKRKKIVLSGQSVKLQYCEWYTVLELPGIKRSWEPVCYCRCGRRPGSGSEPCAKSPRSSNHSPLHCKSTAQHV